MCVRKCFLYFLNQGSLPLHTDISISTQSALTDQTENLDTVTNTYKNSNVFIQESYILWYKYSFMGMLFNFWNVVWARAYSAFCFWFPTAEGCLMYSICTWVHQAFGVCLRRLNIHSATPAVSRVDYHLFLIYKNRHNQYRDWSRYVWPEVNTVTSELLCPGCNAVNVQPWV